LELRGDESFKEFEVFFRKVNLNSGLRHVDLLEIEQIEKAIQNTFQRVSREGSED